ncbi:MAG: ATP-binding cassette domain-containing protein [Verrucomicrobia bacterium]|nr:ATP-binding cassette domain-containing protein [Verrucomicrobiota bacterium]MBI3870086.1 ATP-binding cassette domain-containing protein [Verrucomicrobiota bacterium]
MGIHETPITPSKVPPIPPLATADRVSVGYDGRPILAEASFVLERGAFAGLLGSNGSGKSTLIKSLVGILPLCAGRFAFRTPDGHALVFGYVPQRESLDPVFPLSSLEVALMGVCGRLRPGRMLGRSQKTWARECLSQSGAGDLESKPFSQLSGGQKQRVLIARALVARPDLLVLDEPTAGVDPAATVAIVELLTRLHREQGLTILMVNHDLGVVRKTVQQVLWIHNGVLSQGPVEEMLSQARLEAILELRLQ